MDFSILMVLIDYILVIAFGFAAVILLRDLYNKMSKGTFDLFSAGVINIFIAGELKATWKLLYTLGVCNFESLNFMFFPVQSIGFLIAGVGILAMICHRQSEKTALLATVPPVFSGTFIFVSFMVAGLGLIDTVLCILAFKLKKPWLTILFALSFVCSLCMGYLSSRDFTQALMNWIAEGVNALGQGALLVGVFILHRYGLAELKLKSGDNQ